MRQIHGSIRRARLLWAGPFDWAKTPYRILVVVAALISLTFFVVSLGRPITDWHAFRQTQTANSVYWMLREAAWLDYETPVFGPPWSIPFEFPLYQWLVALVSLGTRLSIDDSGRIVSYFWLVTGLVPTYFLFKKYSTRSAYIIYCALFLVSPLYLFYGRSVLIETQAVAFGLWFLYFFSTTDDPRHTLNLFLAILCATLMALTKITTVTSFYLVAMAIACGNLLKLRGEWRRQAAVLATFCAATIPPILLFELWNAHADFVKSHNPFGIYLESSAPFMIEWNFGTLGQRMEIGFFRAILRAIMDSVGFSAFPLTILIGVILYQSGRWDSWKIVAVCFAAFLAPFAIFAHLNVLHNYYQVANGLFMIAGVSITLDAIRPHAPRPTAIIAVLLALGEIARFGALFLPAWFEAPSGRDVRVAQAIRQNTPDGSAIRIYGLDWSSAVPYYAERKALMEPETPSVAHREERLRMLTAPVGALTTAAIVRCASALDGNPAVERAFAELGRHSRAQRIDDCTIYYPRP